MTDLKPWTPRRVRGRINWDSPQLKAEVRRRLALGDSLVVIARDWNVKHCTLHAHVTRRAYDALPEDRVTYAELQDALNLSNVGVHALVRRSGLTAGRWGRLRTLTHEQADALSQRAPIVRTRPFGYVTLAELAAAWQVSTPRVRAILPHDLPRLAWIGDGPRVKYLYDARLTAQHAPPVAPKTCPAGRVTTGELADMLGVSPVIVTGWLNLGCPSIKGRKDRYYRPDEMTAWLLTRPKPHMRSLGRTLATLAQQQGAA